MNKLCTIIAAFLITSNAYGVRPFYEDLPVKKLSEYAETILLAELVSGTYDRGSDTYNVTLSPVVAIKGSALSEYKLSHQHGWNRLQKLGGYYLVYLDSNSELVKTGSAIVPILAFGGSFSGATLEEAAAEYKLPENAWFTLGGKLWALKNCFEVEHPTCNREKELLENTFNKSSKKDAASGASS